MRDTTAPAHPIAATSAPAPGDAAVSAQELQQALDGVRAVEPLWPLLLQEQPLAVSGLRGSAAAYLIAALYRERPDTWLLVAPDLQSAEALCDDLETWGVGAVHYLSELEILPFDRKSPTRELTATIQAGLDRLDRGEPGLYVTTVYGLRHKVMGRDVMRRNRIALRAGQTLRTEELAQQLAHLGYRPCGLVEIPGDFALRGGLIDVYSPSHELPLRIELLGDQVESIRTFEPIDQRSRQLLTAATIIPAAPLVADDDTLLNALARVESMAEIPPDDRTHLLDRLQDRLHFTGIEGLAPFFHPQETYLDYLPDGATLVWLAPDDLARRSEELDLETARVRADRIRRGDPVPRAEELMAPAEELARHALRLRPLWLAEVVLPGAAPTPLGPGAHDALVRVQTHGQERGNGDVAALLATAARCIQERSRALLFCDNRGQVQRLGELIEEQDPALSTARPSLRVGLLTGGFVWTQARLACFTDHELFDRYHRRARKPRFRGAGRVCDPTALRPADYVVHVDHGIGRFLGLRVITAVGIRSECLLLEYADGDRLYLPTANLLLLERYEVSEGQEPQLHKLGSGQWERTKTRARKAIAATAQELLALYAARALLPGVAFPHDDHLQQEMESSFIHEETPDQLAAVGAVKGDMEQPRPMDRLLCGDVGFGKTEVAIRAAFKAVMAGHQVALLCPTTILAEQHGTTFTERLRDYPVNLAVISRFRSPKEQKAILQRLREGCIDILIGTHRLLQRDVEFRKLGLLVIDEEHRFGVRAKERLKAMRKEVDVLSMTATPIPRTLHLALMGARDMSIIATPPRDRLPIHTEVVPFSEEMIEEAILREMHRGGQVFFVHNRVETIDAMAGIVGRIVPTARIAVAHGQMVEAQLETIMRDFLSRAHDVLVSTMIIESGLDMPNVNTILIDRADRLGLSQLHQLRGRVGRSRHRAYAYLMVPSGETLAQDARRRLAAIEEFTDLGSGYHVAMRDLEIRGAGNILGEAQHGHITAIGFDLYCKLLEEEILELKGEGRPKLHEVQVDLKVPAFLPDEYVADPQEKIRCYRELSRVEDERALDGLVEELRDRFGRPPAEARNLADVTRIKLRALATGVADVRGGRKGVRMLFSSDRQPGSSILRRLIGTGVPRLTFNAVDRLTMTVEAPREEWIAAVLAVLGQLADLMAGAAA